MRIPNNSGINLEEFPYQLTNWMTLREIYEAGKSGLSPLMQIVKHEGRNSYGKHFIIRKSDHTYKNKKNHTEQCHYYAIFTRGESEAVLET